MQRRGFLKMLGLAPAAATLPAVIGKLWAGTSVRRANYFDQAPKSDLYRNDLIPQFSLKDIPTKNLKRAIEFTSESSVPAKKIQFYRYEPHTSSSSLTVTVEEAASELEKRERLPQS